MNTDTPTSQGTVTTGTPSPATVLVADDSRVMRVALSRLLSKLYTVVEAENGEQAWQLLQENRDIELVFSDLSMPVMDGFELLRRARASEDPDINALPFVVITGHEDDEGMQRKAAGMGANDFVAKPFRSAEITTRAKSLIGQRRDLKRLRDELTQRATLDAVTGLSDRPHFTEHFDALLSLARRHGLHSACLALQVDDFAGLSTQLPEADVAGLLRRVADLLRAASRSEDAAGYLGDGCYALALAGTDRDGAQHLAARLGERWQELPLPDGAVPGLLIGVSSPSTDHTLSAESLLEAAQTELKPVVAATAAPAPQAPTAAPMDAPRGPEAKPAPAAPAPAEPAPDTKRLARELDQLRASLDATERANGELAAQLNKLQEGARAQVAKAHQEMNTLRSQLAVLQTQFDDYRERYSPELAAQAKQDIAALRADLSEREQQLQTERAAHQAVVAERERLQAEQTQLQAELTRAQQTLEETHAALEESRKPRGLFARLFRRA